jgi:diguanylate cyclase (GGDEF)-like protein
MHDAVIFVDGSLRIVLWNRASERLTGILAPSIEHKIWSPTLVGLRDEQQRLIGDADCPVNQSIKSGVQTLRRLSVAGRNGQRVDVDAHLVPVYGKNGVSHGAALLLHDASSRITLEQRVQSLHEKATRDPLTQVANRAEFDRIHASWVESHLERRLPCSLVICDIDHFKRINDNFGHQAGDEVLIAFAALLKRHCRAGDLVARYGGEEFVMICADCDNSTATARAEELRAELAELPMIALSGRYITASFGVTEVQPGDTPETMLRRADRALYQAKEGGRNMVIQLGSGIAGDEQEPRRTSWWAWLRGRAPDQVLHRTFASSIPRELVVEKIRGFVADHFAQIESQGEGQLVLRIDGESGSLLRRASDRVIPFLIQIDLDENSSGVDLADPARIVRTLLHVTVSPQRSRDRRRRDVLEKAQRLLASLKSYLLAQELKAGR